MHMHHVSLLPPPHRTAATWPHIPVCDAWRIMSIHWQNVNSSDQRAAGKRFNGAKAPASLKFAFNRWYRVRITADSSLTLRCADQCRLIAQTSGSNCSCHLYMRGTHANLCA